MVWDCSMKIKTKRHKHGRILVLYSYTMELLGDSFCQCHVMVHTGPILSSLLWTCIHVPCWMCRQPTQSIPVFKTELMTHRHSRKCRMLKIKLMVKAINNQLFDISFTFVFFKFFFMKQLHKQWFVVFKSELDCQGKLAPKKKRADRSHQKKSNTICNTIQVIQKLVNEKSD